MKVTEQEFTVKAIENLRKKNPDGTPKYRGVHSVFSGFNSAFREYFGTDPITAVRKLEAEGVIKTKPVRGGVMLYKAGEMPEYNTTSEVLSRILS